MPTDPLFITVTEVVQAMRAAGIRVDSHRLNGMYDDGRAPFMSLDKVGPTGRRTYRIYRAEFQAWLARATQTAGKEAIL